MLDINLKQYIREFMEMKMEQAKGMSKHFSVSPGILIRDDPNKIEFEMFLDELWVFISKKNLEHEQHSQSKI